MKSSCEENDEINEDTTKSKTEFMDNNYWKSTEPTICSFDDLLLEIESNGNSDAIKKSKIMTDSSEVKSYVDPINPIKCDDENMYYDNLFWKAIIQYSDYEFSEI